MSSASFSLGSQSAEYQSRDQLAPRLLPPNPLLFRISLMWKTGGEESRTLVSMDWLTRQPLWCRNGCFLSKRTWISHMKSRSREHKLRSREGGGAMVSVGRLWNVGLSSSSVFFPLTISSLELRQTTRKTCFLTPAFSRISLSTCLDCPSKPPGELTVPRT